MQRVAPKKIVEMWAFTLKINEKNPIVIQKASQPWPKLLGVLRVSLAEE